MAMQWLENELRKTGDPHDALNADSIAEMLKRRSKDIPLPLSKKISSENPRAEILRFSRETKTLLSRNPKWHVLELTGKSIKELRATDHPFWLAWTSVLGDKFDDFTSRRSEVAIMQDYIYSLDGRDLEFPQQAALEMAGFDRWGKYYGDVDYIIPGLGDYAELAFNMFKSGYSIPLFILDGSTTINTGTLTSEGRCVMEGCIPTPRDLRLEPEERFGRFLTTTIPDNSPQSKSADRVVMPLLVPVVK